LHYKSSTNYLFSLYDFAFVPLQQLSLEKMAVLDHKAAGFQPTTKHSMALPHVA